MALRGAEHLAEQGIVIDLRHINVDAVACVGPIVDQLFRRSVLATAFGGDAKRIGNGMLLTGGAGAFRINIELRCEF